MTVNHKIRQVRNILKALAHVENADGDTKETVYDRELAKIRELDQDNILEIVKEAVGSDPKLIKYSPYVYAELSNIPGVEAVFGELLSTADAEGRSAIIQTIRLKQMTSLVTVLNEHFTQETDNFCRDQLLHALGKIADESSLPIFEFLMNQGSRRDEWAILCAGISYSRSEFHDYLFRVYGSPDSEKSHRIMAAWGLAKLGYIPAYEYLIGMLDDPEKTFQEGTATRYDPGQSIRAAQAVCDISGWDFEWGRHSVQVVKERIQFS